MPAAFFRMFLQAGGRQARSNVISTLGIFLTVMTGGLISAAYVDAEWWIKALFALGLWLGIVLYLSAYVYFAIKDPELLRSEQFTLSKMALEKGMIGDTEKGFVDPMKNEGILTIPASAPQLEDQR
jgi:hypothetical protein